MECKRAQLQSHSNAQSTTSTTASRNTDGMDSIRQERWKTHQLSSCSLYSNRISGNYTENIICQTLNRHQHSKKLKMNGRLVLMKPQYRNKNITFVALEDTFADNPLAVLEDRNREIHVRRTEHYKSRIRPGCSNNNSNKKTVDIYFFFTVTFFR